SGTHTTTADPARPYPPPPPQPPIPAPGEDSHFDLRDTFVRFSPERLSRSPLLRSLALTLTSFPPFCPFLFSSLPELWRSWPPSSFSLPPFLPPSPSPGVC
ncbi:unnamed protein product, partial [Rangifer tarandus platyrhynchus]